MNTIRTRGTQALLAAVLAAMIATPIAIANAGGGGVARQVKAEVAKQTRGLRQQLAALSARENALEGRPSPASLPPSGPAGGDLSENYPDPELRPASVESLEIKNGGVASVDIRPGAVSSSELIGAHAVIGTPKEISPGTGGTASVTCPPEERLLSGGFEWLTRNREGDVVQVSSPSEINHESEWFAVGRVAATAPSANKLVAIALCLGA